MIRKINVEPSAADKCPNNDTLALVLQGSSPTAKTESHIESCTLCQNTLAEMTASECDMSWPDAPMPEYLLGMAEQLASQTNEQCESPTVAIPGFEILECVGRGGMGVVYRARHEQLDREVAVKVIATGAHAGEEYRQRLQREGQLVARLDHPNIVRIFDSGEHAQFPFLVLELMDGGSLSSLKTELTDPNECARLIEILARALHLAHEAGIIHRDLKPANVLLCKAELRSPNTIQVAEQHLVPKIADFGLSKEVFLAESITHSTGVLGTPGYMSPEQANELRDEIGPATDIHALGVMLYELLTGKRPFDARTALATIENVRSAEPASLRSLRSDTPEAIERICLQCLKKQLGSRYGSALELAEELRRFQNGKPLKYTGRKSFLAGGLRHRKWMATMAVATLGILLSIIHVQTNHGTITIEADDNVNVIVRRNDLRVKSLRVDDSKSSVTVYCGDIEVVIPGDAGSEYSVHNSQFRMTRGQNQVVTIRRIKKDLAPDTKGSNTHKTDLVLRPGASVREVAQWVIRSGGAVGINDKLPMKKSIDDLPKSDFRLSAVADPNGYSENYLAAIGKLPHLTRVSISAPEYRGRQLGDLNQIEKLRFLALFWTQVNDENFQKFDNYQNLTTLRLAGSPISSAFVPRIAKCRKLNTLGLSEHQLLHPDAGELLNQIPSLGTLEVYEFTEASTSILPSVEQLTSIMMHDGQSVNQETITHLCACSNLQRLKFWRSDLASVDLTPLKTLPNLFWLELMNTNTSPEEVAKLAATLPHCDIMYSPERDVASMVLNAGGTFEKELGERRVTQHRTKYHEIEINSISFVDALTLRDDHFVPYQHLRHLNSLTVNRAPINGSTLHHITHLKTLQQLSLLDTKVDDRIIPVLQELPQLKQLDLQQTRVTSRTITSLDNFTELETLRINGNTLTKQTAPVIINLPKLKQLYLVDAADRTLEFLGSAPNIHKLVIDQSYAVTDTSIDFLAKMKNLTSVTLSNTNITDQGIQNLELRIPHCEIKTSR